MSLKIRFLLTSKCTATCAYCHNEGQSGAGASLLHMEQIEHILERFAQCNQPIDEIVLSGGEPTLHKHVGAIAQRCKKAARHLSMDSHGGHPELLAKALPYLDELKLHIDAFDAEEQRLSMGIELAAVDESIRQTQAHPTLKLIANHPLTDVHAGIRFVNEARARNIDCKIIQLFARGLAPCVNWTHQGYEQLADGSWLHANGKHRLYSKSCEEKLNHENTWFIGADGVRTSVDGAVISSVDNFYPLG